MEKNREEDEKEREGVENGGEEEAVDTLTAHFRRTSRGRIVELPRWAQ